MFEKFTERARKVMDAAREEAQRLNNEFIGTEHILLGLLKDDGGVAATILANLNVDFTRARQEIERLIMPNPTPAVTLGQLPLSPRAKRVLELAQETATQLGHNVIGTELLLLGLLKEGEGIAAMVLQNLGVRLRDVHDMVLDLLGTEGNGKPAAEPAEEDSRRTEIDLDQEWRFTKTAKRVFAAAQELARRSRRAQVETTDILIAMARMNPCAAAQLLGTKSAEAGALPQAAQASTPDAATPDSPVLSGPSTRVLNLARVLACSIPLGKRRDELKALERKKVEAIAALDFDRAREVRDRMNELRKGREGVAAVIGTQHILVGMAIAFNCKAARILLQLGVEVGSLVNRAADVADPD